MILFRRYRFQVADRVEAGDRRKCWDINGQRFLTHDCVLKICLWGDVQRLDGMIAPYEVLDATVKPIIKLVDQKLLNSLRDRCSTAEAERVSNNPTTEHLLAWFVARLPLVASVRSPGGDLPTMLRLDSLELQEDEDAGIEWQNEPVR